MAKRRRLWGHRRFARLIATGFGVGTAAPVAPGTAGTLLAVPLYLLIRQLTPIEYLLVVAALFLLGVWACTEYERQSGRHDPGVVVWDEVVGYLITMYLAPYGVWWIVIGFGLFRLYDIWKPFPIRKIDRAVPGGFGTMLDDALAGVYALVTMQLLALLVVL